jgi:hypothetical protein
MLVVDALRSGVVARARCYAESRSQFGLPQATRGILPQGHAWHRREQRSFPSKHQRAQERYPIDIRSIGSCLK